MGAVVAPDERRVHTKPLAVLGGAAILLGFLAGMFVGWRDDSFTAVFTASTVPLGVVLGAIIIFGVGQVDDLREVSPPAKIAGTVLAGSVLSIAGVSILFFRIPFAGLVSLSPDMSAAPHGRVGDRHVDGDQLHRRPRRVGGGDRRHRGGRAAPLLRAARRRGAIGPENAGPLIAAATLGACIGFLPAQLPPGPHHDG